MGVPSHTAALPQNCRLVCRGESGAPIGSKASIHTVDGTPRAADMLASDETHLRKSGCVSSLPKHASDTSSAPRCIRAPSPSTACSSASTSDTTSAVTLSASLLRMFR